MARLIRVPYLASLLVVSKADEIDDLVAHDGLARAFVRKGLPFNRIIVAGLDRQFRLDGKVLPPFKPKDDADRQASQRQLFAHLDRFADAGAWPAAPVAQMARYVVTAKERREAEGALAYAIAWPFLAKAPDTPQDDVYRPVGRHLWRLHRRIMAARRPLRGLPARLLGLDTRARAAILAHVGGDLYGLHAVEITLANARTILEAMRMVVAELPRGAHLTGNDLAWAAIRTAPERVVRQTGDAETSLPHVGERVPPHTLVLMNMRRAMEPASSSGYEFASRQWSACPARRFVMGLFAAVGEAALAATPRAAQDGRASR